MYMYTHYDVTYKCLTFFYTMYRGGRCAISRVSPMMIMMSTLSILSVWLLRSSFCAWVYNMNI